MKDRYSILNEHSTGDTKMNSASSSYLNITRKSLFLTLVIGFFLLGTAIDSIASHYRHGNMSWRQISGNTIEFKISQAYANYGNWTVGQSGYGDYLYFGDGQGQSFAVTITSVNTTEGWFYGETTITHTYPTTGNFIAYFSSCCRIGNLSNNANGYWRVQTIVNVGNGNNSPVSTLPPLVNLPQGLGSASFQIPAFDQDGNTLSYRLANSTEMGGGSNPAGLSVNPSSGLVTYNTIGKSVGQLFSAAIVVADGFTEVTIDFIIKITLQSTAPVFDYAVTPASGTVYQVSPGQNVSFSIKATDQDVGDNVTLQGIGMPVGVTMIPALPASGNPVQSSFNWTPSNLNLGTNVINFIAQDNQGVQASSSVTILVSLKPLFVVPPTPVANSYVSVVPGQAVSANILAIDPDPLDLVVISAVQLPAGMSFSPALPTAGGNPVNTNLSWTPVASQWGHQMVKLKATDTYNDFVNHAFEYVVNTPPVFASLPVSTVTVGASYTYNIEATDSDIPYGDAVSIVSSASLPSWLSLQSTGNGTATLSGSPVLADAGDYTITLMAEDIHHHASATIPLQTFTITVNPCNIVLSEIHTIENCVGSADASIDVTGSGVNMPATYSWNGPDGFIASTEDISGLTKGVYTLDVVDAFGCTANLSVTIIQEDNTYPTAIAQDITAYLDINGNVSITAAQVDNGSFDNCGIASLVLNKTAFSCSDIGENTITLTATDVHGNVNSATAEVIVIDSIAPLALCKTATLTLNAGSALLTPQMVDNGSNDACGIRSLSVSPATFDCSNIGVNEVILTVTDNNGNVSTCNTSVTIVGEIPSCFITLALANNIYTGGDGKTIFLGYGPQSLTASVNASGGAPFTYSWDGGNGYLSSTTSANPVFTPTAEGIYTLIATVTNAYGCQTSCEVSICVLDIRAGGNGNNAKVYLCHVPNGNPNNPQTLKVSVNAVPAHLGNHAGDRLGHCDQSCGSISGNKSVFINAIDGDDHDHEASVNVYPNPSSTTFNFILESHSDELLSLYVFEASGRLLISRENITPNDEISFGENLPVGVFYAKIIQGDFVKTVKIVKTR